MRVDVEEVLALRSRLADLNRLDFSSIVWHEDGKPLSIPEVAKEDWKFVGLSNTDFINLGVYKIERIDPLAAVVTGDV